MRIHSTVSTSCVYKEVHVCDGSINRLLANNEQFKHTRRIEYFQKLCGSAWN